jgi:hypothetical protein
MEDLLTIFGRPGEGVHEHYEFSFAIKDVAMTGVAAVLIAKVFNKSVFTVFVALIALGIGAHVLFGVPTALNQKLGLAPEGIHGNLELHFLCRLILFDISKPCCLWFTAPGSIEMDLFTQDPLNDAPDLLIA